MSRIGDKVKTKKILVGALSVLMAFGSVQMTAFADDKIVYGTMNIPYADFFASECGIFGNHIKVE
ncbi:MAG: hypothetical protein ACI4DP_09955 [Candidatus Ornithomonoglobus sp.]